MLSSRNDFMGNYPAGSDTPDAPWNQPDTPTKEADVYCEQILSRDTHLNEADYDPYEEEFYDLMQSYIEEHETPLSLIEQFKKYLETGKISNKDYWIEECKNWTEVNTEIEQQ